MSDMFKMFMYGGVIKEDICFPKYIVKLLFTVIVVIGLLLVKAGN